MRKFVLAVLTLIVVLTSTTFLLAHALGPERYDLDQSAFAGGPDQDTVLATMTKDATDSRRPNVVIILADDLGYGDVGACGGTVIDTPNIDRLAAEGIRFTHAYASASVCSPSRAGLLTGRYPLRSGIIAAMQMANDTLLRKSMAKLGIALSQLAIVDVPGGANMVPGLPSSEVTLAEALGASGYNTMATGKWHLGDFTVLPEYHPFNHGFDEFVGFNGSNDDFPVAFWRGDEEIVEDIGAEQEPYTGIFTQAATDFIRKDRDTPFFLYLAQKDPHLPFYPSEEFAGESDGGAYGDAVEELDWSVGEVLRALEETGQRANTLVVFTSDNGPWYDGSPGKLRGRKGQSYEGGFRVPLLMSMPGRIPQGQTRETPTMNFDLYATALEAAGVALPQDRRIDGVSLWTILTDMPAPPEERPLYFFHDYDVEAIREGPWKLISAASHWVWPVPLDKPHSLIGGLAGARDYTPPGTDEKIPTLGTWPLLYRVDRDAEEAYDLKRHHPDRVEKMSAQLEAWRSDFYDNPRGWNQ